MASAESTTPTPEKEGWEAPVALRLVLLLATVFIFFLAINLMGGALKALTKTYVSDLLRQATANPVVGLLLGILATSIIQSSSTTTSIVVTFVATGWIGLEGAVPIVMGANIGTTVTNTLVSFTHVRRKTEFGRALAAGTVHDWFNILAVLVLFPLEVYTHVIQRSAEWLQSVLIGTSIGKVDGLKTLIKPIVGGVLDAVPTWLALVISLLVLFTSLTLMVKIMRSIFITKMARILDRFLFRNAFTAFVVGIVFTILVQSSSVTTSLVVPLVGAGILTIRQVFPYTVGANIGTTVTAFLAALALAAGAEATDTTIGLGVTVALVHLLFNIFGIAIIYPFRSIPIRLAEWLGRHAAVSPRRALFFLLIYFLAYLGPLVILLFV